MTKEQLQAELDKALLLIEAKDEALRLITEKGRDVAARMVARDALSLTLQDPRLAEMVEAREAVIEAAIILRTQGDVGPMVRALDRYEAARKAIGG